MKKHLLSLAAMALLTPAFYAMALEGSGTQADPYRISTVDDLKAMAGVEVTTYHWYVLENDLDLQGSPWTPLYTKTVGKLHFDGNKHIIRNLTSTVAYASLFGQFDGSCTNLGLENVSCKTAGAWDPAGTFAAYAGSYEVTTFTGCYAIGEVNAYYAGGIIGGTKAGVVMKDCYASVDASSGTFAGGMCAAINYLVEGEGTVTLKLENCYADGSINSKGGAGGILGSSQSYLHPQTSTEVLDMTNVVAMNMSVNGAYASPFAGIPSADWTFTKVIENNAYVYEDMLVNSKKVESGISYDDCISTITSWEAFALDDAFMPVLKWQLDDQAGIFDVSVDNDEDTPAVYYNLQGVQVENPESGIYVVRRGNKVSKQLVK